MTEYPTLPEEVLSLICDELGQAEEFDTLYACARSTRSLADSALRVLYERHHRSFAFNQTEDDFRGREGETSSFVRSPQDYFRKWILLWRSIIISSLDLTTTLDTRITRRPTTTYKPYCRYLRILDFGNLSDMLESPHFRQNQDLLYAAPLEFIRPKSYKRRIHTEADTVAMISQIGETIIPTATRLEELSGHIRPGDFQRWVSSTPRLRRTALWRGDALDQGAGAAVAAHCKLLKELSIYTWTNSDADEVFATFLNDLEPDMLRYLEFRSVNTIARGSFQALSRQSTLKELHLSNLSSLAMQNLDALQECTSLEVLYLEETGVVALEGVHDHVLQAVVRWLSSCTELRDITIKRFVDGPAILAAVAVCPQVKWVKLSLEGYIVRDPRAVNFHTALAEQQSLEVLSLKGNGEGAPVEYLNNMVSSMCALSNLKELILKQVSDEFESEHIVNLALSLTGLEELWTSGGDLSADVLPIFSNLRSLKNLTLFAVTQFDYDKICEFITSLDPQSQQGFQLSLMAVDQRFDLSESQQSEIASLIKVHLNGSFGE